MHSCEIEVSNRSALSVIENKTLGLAPSEFVNAADHGVSNGNGVPDVPSDLFAGGKAHGPRQMAPWVLTALMLRVFSSS